MNRTGRQTPSQGNRSLSSAKSAKQDEFTTQLADVENELKYDRPHFQGKVVLCNCDDPFESNFFKDAAANFNTPRLKKLFTTSYGDSPIVGDQFPLAVVEENRYKTYYFASFDTRHFALDPDERYLWTHLFSNPSTRKINRCGKIDQRRAHRAGQFEGAVELLN